MTTGPGRYEIEQELRADWNATVDLWRTGLAHRSGTPVWRAGLARRVSSEHGARASRATMRAIRRSHQGAAVKLWLAGSAAMLACATTDTAPPPDVTSDSGQQPKTRHFDESTERTGQETRARPRDAMDCSMRASAEHGVSRCTCAHAAIARSVAARASRPQLGRLQRWTGTRFTHERAPDRGAWCLEAARVLVAPVRDPHWGQCAHAVRSRTFCVERVKSRHATVASCQRIRRHGDCS